MNTDDVLDIILSAVKPKMVAVFGSHARGEASELSDIDILVITNNEQDRERLSGIESGEAEIHTLTMRTALELIHNQDPFFRKILSEAKPLYGRFYLNFLREVVKNVGKGKNMA